MADRVVRRHAHDLRNHLNGIELGTTLISELAGEDPDIRSTLEQIRRQMEQMEHSLQSLVLRFSPPRHETLRVGDLMGLWKSRLDPALETGGHIEWSDCGDSDRLVRADREIFPALLCELTLVALGRAHEGTVRIRMQEQQGPEFVLEIRGASSGDSFLSGLMEEMAWMFGRQGCRLSCSRDDISRKWTALLTLPAAPETAEAMPV